MTPVADGLAWARPDRAGPAPAAPAAPRLFAWRDRGIGFAAGAALALTQPPYDFLPVLLLSFTTLVLLIDRSFRVRATPASARAAAAALGWCFGFGYFLAGLWWIGAAFLVDADKFAWLLPFAVAGLPAGLALFFALATFLAAMVWPAGPLRLVALAAACTVSEWLRGVILTGFPWNEIGYALTGSAELMQAASLVGVNGLTFLAVLVGAAPAALLDRRGAWRPFAGTAALAGAAVLIAALWIAGSERLRRAESLGSVPGLTLRLVQPAIAQKDKWNPALREANFERLLTLSREGETPLGPGTLLIWPESSLPFFYQVTPLARIEIADLLPPGAVLVTGALRFEGDPAGDPRALDVYNSIFVVDAQGEVIDAYDKVDLVPFGEFLPLQPWLEAIGLRQLTELKGGFVAGSERRTLTVGTAPAFVPLICYEVIFSGRIGGAGGDRPGWLLNLTNDAWFGDTAGPHQHLRQARLRAVETGLPVVRAANTGISAIIDPYGQMVAGRPLDTAAVMDQKLPRAIATTPFSIFRNAKLQPVFVLGLVPLFLMFAFRKL